MHPSSNNNGYKPPKTSSFGDYYNDANHSRTPQEHYYAPSSFSSFYLPSPNNYIHLEDDEAVFCESFQQQHLYSNDHNHLHNTIILAHDMTTNVESIMGDCGSNNGQVAMNDHGDDEPYNTHSPRKRHSKGDRHSKIDTARGPRDRRIRLSLDVAKKLFGLQDFLGFDKASKAVDWLITKSRTAILELLPDHQSCSFMGVSNTNSASSTSECEVLSGTVDQSILKTGDDQETTKNKAKSTSGSSKKQRGVRKSADFHHPLAKATRERARARARERTIEKRNHKLSVDQDSKSRPCMDQAMDQDVNQLGYWSLLEENQCQPDQMSSQFQFKQGFVGDNSPLMMTGGNLSPSYLFNYQQSAGLTHEHHLNEFQVIGRSWEGNNN